MMLTVLSMVPLYSFGQDNSNRVQHEFFWSFGAFAVASHDASVIINSKTAFVRLRWLKLGAMWETICLLFLYLTRDRQRRLRQRWLNQNINSTVESLKKRERGMWYLYTIVSNSGLQCCHWRHCCWHHVSLMLELYKDWHQKSYDTSLTIAWTSRYNGAINCADGIIWHWLQHL